MVYPMYFCLSPYGDRILLLDGQSNGALEGQTVSDFWCRLPRFVEDSSRSAGSLFLLAILSFTPISEDTLNSFHDGLATVSYVGP